MGIKAHVDRVRSRGRLAWGAAAAFVFASVPIFGSVVQASAPGCVDASSGFPSYSCGDSGASITGAVYNGTWQASVTGQGYAQLLPATASNAYQEYYNVGSSAYTKSDWTNNMAFLCVGVQGYVHSSATVYSTKIADN